MRERITYDNHVGVLAPPSTSSETGLEVSSLTGVGNSGFEGTVLYFSNWGSDSEGCKSKSSDNFSEHFVCFVYFSGMGFGKSSESPLLRR